MKKLIQYLSFILFILLSFISQAQIEDDSTKILSTSFILKVANNQKGVIRYFGEHEEIIYKLNDAPTLKLKGKIVQISKDSIFVNGKQHAISDLIYLASKAQKRESHFISIMLAVAGGISTTSGIMLLVVGETIVKIIGTTSAIIGTPLLIGGITKYFTSNYLIPEKDGQLKLSD